MLKTALQRVRNIVMPVQAHERWSVKTGTDPLAITVQLTPVPTTIEALISLPVPKKPTIRTAAEMVVYTVPCTIKLWKLESDLDHHLVLVDDQGRTMIGEIPDPSAIVGTSAWQAEITAAHTQFDAWPRLGKPCLVTGILYFDFNHSQTGVAPNAVELHPILSIVDPAGVVNGTV